VRIELFHHNHPRDAHESKARHPDVLVGCFDEVVVRVKVGAFGLNVGDNFFRDNFILLSIEVKA
jgi:hypothetical protein